jgi:hypothetical protein
MSTRSRVGMFIRDDAGNKVIRSIYIHSDGYPSYVGDLLLQHWSEPQRVEKLLALGDLSTLGAKIGAKHPFDWRYSFQSEAQKGARESGESVNWAAHFEEVRKHPLADMCTAYMRDRGETGLEAVVSADIEAFEATAIGTGCEWAYLFDPDSGEWGCASVYGSRSWVPLGEAVATDKAETEARLSARVAQTA